MTPPGPPPVPGGRSPEDREAARRQREARRSDPGVADDGARETGRDAGRTTGERGVDWRERARRLASARVERRRTTGPPADSPEPLRRGPRAGGFRRRRAFAVLGGAALAAALFAAWLLFSLLQPFAGDGKGEGQVPVRVPAGAGLGTIADELERRGVVGSAFFFKTRARVSGRAGELRPGLYRLGEGMSYAAVLDALSRGPAPDVLQVTVPEGRSRREVARVVQLRGSYVAATRRSDELDPSRYGAPRGSSLEGFLFPSTYELKRRSPVTALVDEQLAAFRKQFAKVDLAGARRANLSPYEVLTIASMVEREAQLPRERAVIASVIHNRLREGIPLGIDATIRYATNNWDRPLRESELANRSPFNTRLNKGLPPGPIGSPGLDAIRAAAKPARSGFLFYVVKPGTCGEHDFSRTNAEFLADVARYNRERAARGGRSPTKC